MVKLLQATNRGQITLPKIWRDRFKTTYYAAEFKGEMMIIKPIKNEASAFEKSVEKSWKQYKNGEVIEAEKLMKKYGL